MVAGNPAVITYKAVFLCIIPFCQYPNTPEIAVGIVTGKGEAIAVKSGIPKSIFRRGVAIILPPIPNIPDKNPIIIPINI